MSPSADMQALIERNLRLEAELEVQRHDSASRIKDLEHEVHHLKVEKRLSALKSEGQTEQVAVSSGPSDPDLRAEMAVRDAQRDKEVSALLGLIKAYRRLYYSLPVRLREVATTIETEIDTAEGDMPRALVAALQDVDREVIAETLGAEREAQHEEEPTAEASITDTEKFAGHEAQREKEPTVKVSATGIEKSADHEDKQEPASKVSEVTDPNQPAGHEAQEKPTPERSVIDSDRSAEPFSTTSSTVFQGKTRIRPNEPSPGSTPARFPEYSASKGTVSSPSRLNYAQSFTQRPYVRGGSRPRPKIHFTQMSLTRTHAQVAKRKAEQEASSEPQKQQRLGLEGPHEPRSTPIDDPSDSDAGVRNPLGFLGGERGKLGRFGDLREGGQLRGLTLNPSRGEVAPLISKPKIDPEERRLRISFGEIFPEEEDALSTDAQDVAPPVSATPQSTEVVELGPEASPSIKVSDSQGSKPSSPPAQQLETRDSGLNNTAPATPEPF